MTAFYQSIKMALKSIASNKLRAFLTMLGIIIGVMALVILVSLVNGATGQVTDTISSLGTNMISVSVEDDKGVPVTLEVLEDWAEEDTIAAAAPEASESVTGKFEDETGTVSVIGTTPAYGEIQGLVLKLGRFLKSSDVENHTQVCVINETLAADLVGYEDCLGEIISLNGSKYTIVGILDADEESLMTSFMGSSMTAYVPYTSLVRLSDEVTANIDSFYIAPAENVTTEAAQETMERILMERFEADDDAFEITTSDAIESAMSTITSALTILLGGIAAISLIVGGIGIMNIMLVTVTERTREIGIRKAIGASRGAILLQFLIEAVVLCMMGCLLGIVLSWGVLQGVTVIVSSLDMTFDMNGQVVAIAVGFCFAIGVLFGLYPANKAAQMKPIDALHYGG